MKNKKVVLIILIIFAVLLVGASTMYNQLQSKVSSPQMDVHEVQGDNEIGEATKEVAKDFTVYDINGDVVHLSDFAGKPIVLNFWASWCGPCKAEMPDFNEQYKEVGDSVHFVMVNLTDGYRETVQTASEFITQQGFEFPVYYDKDYDASLKYDVYSIPTTLFIDAEGYIVAEATGMIDAAKLKSGIEKIK